MSQSSGARARSRSRDLLDDLTSIGWPKEYPSLSLEQTDELIRCLGGDLSEEALGRFSHGIKYLFHRAQALQIKSARLAAGAARRHSRTPRPNIETQLRDETRALQATLGRATKALMAVSPIVVLAVDEQLDESSRRRFWPPLDEGEGMEVLLRRAKDALSDLELALSGVNANVSSGRKDEATRMTVEALARLYLDVRGRMPKRSFTIEESGDFLEFTRAFMRMVEEALPREAQLRISRSLSKIVRGVLADRNHGRSTYDWGPDSPKK